jgi:hypothetical protein
MESRLSTLVTLAAAAGLSIATNLFAQDNLNPNPGAQALEGKIQLLGTVSPWLKKALSLGPADASERVLITAYLGWRNQGELQQLLQDQTDLDSARYGEFLTPEEFHAEFSPRTEDVTLVRLSVGTHWYDDAPIIDVNAPTRPIGGLIGVLGVDNFVGFGTVDSTLDSNGNVVENVDSSLRSRPGYDSATGLGAPNVPSLIRALSREW